MKHFTVTKLKPEKYDNKFKFNSEEVQGGSRPRLTFQHTKDKKKYFFKTYTKTPREVWAECLASHIAEIIGLTAQQVTIKLAPEKLEEVLRAKFKESFPDDWIPIGSLARNLFPKDVEIMYGSGIVGSGSEPLTLADIEKFICSRYYAPEDLLQTFSDMVVFDIFIGNMDRHHDNWAVCEKKLFKQFVLLEKKQTKELRYFAPLFDHGSSLMFELDDGKVSEFLKDEKKLNHYVEHSKFGFILDLNSNKSNIFDTLEQHITSGTKWKPRLCSSLEKIKNTDMLGIASLVLQMPNIEELDYGLDRRSLLYKSLLLRYNKLMHLYERI